MNRKELVSSLVVSNMEFVSSIDLEAYDSFTTDLLYALFARFSDEELLEEAKRLGIEEVE